MNEQNGTVQKQSTSGAPARGILMFKDHIAAMKVGSKLLGGERPVQAREKDRSQVDE